VPWPSKTQKSAIWFTGSPSGLQISPRSWLILTTSAALFTPLFDEKPTFACGRVGAFSAPSPSLSFLSIISGMKLSRFRENASGTSSGASPDASTFAGAVGSGALRLTNDWGSITRGGVVTSAAGGLLGVEVGGASSGEGGEGGGSYVPRGESP